jgi:hypothetical protein
MPQPCLRPTNPRRHQRPLNNPNRPPTPSVGIESSWYIDFLTGNVFGPKTLGQWPATPSAQIPIGSSSNVFTAEGNILVAGTNGVGIRDSGTQLLKTYIGTVAPGVGQDSSQGYSIGSSGVNTSNGTIYVAKTVAPGAAVWIITSIPGVATYIAATDPTATNDSTQGYVAGSPGVNTATGRTFVAKSVSVGAAVWASAGVPIVNAIAGKWYIPRDHASFGASNAVASTTLVVLTPFFINQPQTVNGLGTRIFTAGTTNVQVSVYAASSTTNLPTGLPLITTANIDDTATGPATISTSPDVQLPSGMYWGAVEAGDVTVVLTGPTANIVSTYIGTITAGPSSCITAPSAGFGTWPDLTAATFTYLSASKCGIISYRNGSVP